jgi:hypothetical protein
VGEKAETITMNFHPDLEKVDEWSKFLEDQVENKAEIKTMYLEAIKFLKIYDWCGEILKSYVGMLYLGIVGVFLFKIAPTRNNVDEWVWVIIGDLPPAYLTVDSCPNPASALDGYIGAMQEWIEAVEQGKSVAELIPVDVPATRDYSKMLKVRLKFLDEKVLSEYGGDIKA